MTPLTPFLARQATALVAGAAAGTGLLALAPQTYWDLVDLRLFDLPGAGGAVTLHRLTGEGLMAAFFLLLGMEALEAATRERGVRGRGALLPLSAAAGGMAGAALVWALAAALAGAGPETAAAPGWAVAFGSDVVIAAALGRIVLGPAHPALQVLLLALVCENLAALALTGLLAPEAALRPVWLLVPLAAALAGWLFLTRPAGRPGAAERDRLRAARLLPWAGLAVLSWAGVAASGLPGTLGALPVLPAMPRAARGFGLFAAAEDFLGDPVNRLERRMQGPLVAVLALFGFTHLGVDLAAAGPETAAAALAAAAGKPAGMALGMAATIGLLRAPLPSGVTPGDLGRVALLSGVCLTVPALTLERLLPAGAAAEAARLGFVLAALAAAGWALAVRARARRGP